MIHDPSGSAAQVIAVVFPTSPLLTAGAGLGLALFALGLGVGFVVERRHARGWYRRPGDPPPRRTRGVPTVMTALAWLLLALSLPAPTTPPAVVVLLTHLAFAAVLVAAACVDVCVQRLPDVLTLPAGAAATVLSILAVVAGDGPTSEAGARALLAGVVVPALTLVAALAVRGLGLGDVKLSWSLAAVSAWHGWSVLAAGLAITWLLAGLTAALLLLTGHADRRTPLPLGPFLALGPLLALALAMPLAITPVTST